MQDAATPYSTLHPDLILQAIEQCGLPCSGGLVALNSYENRVYQVGLDDAEPVIAKFYRPNRWSPDCIREEHAFALELTSHDIPVIAPLVIEGESLHTYAGFLFALFKRQGGRAIELDNLEQLEMVGRYIGRMHAVGAARPFQHRIQIDINTYGVQPFDFLMQNRIIPLELESQYRELVTSILHKLNTIFTKYQSIQRIRLHGDCHIGNILWRDPLPYIVDLDDCLMGPAIQDIWMLLSGNQPEENRTQLNAILNGYEDFYEFDYRELHLIEALRTLRMLHYSAWLAKRWHDPAFPLNFPWFSTIRYWQEQLQQLHDQHTLLDNVEI
jgi:Ser/Thr protein kinase RdoA (MazF antagonist)